MRKRISFTRMLLVALLAVACQNVFGVNVVKLTHSTGEEEFASLEDCFTEMRDTYTPASGVFTLTFLADITENGVLNSEFERHESGYAPVRYIDLHSKGGLSKVIVDGNGYSINSETSKNPDGVYASPGWQNTCITMYLPDNAQLEIKNLTLNDHVVFKPWLNCVDHTSKPNATLYIHDCKFTGLYYSYGLLAKEARFEKNIFEPNGDWEQAFLIWIDGIDKYSYDHRVIFNNNFARCNRIINTSTNVANLWYTIKKKDMVFTNNTMVIKDNANYHVTMIQANDALGDITITGNKVLGRYTKNESRARSLLIHYLHASTLWDKDVTTGRESYMYNDACKVVIKNNYYQCGMVDMVVRYNSGAVKLNYGDITDARKGTFYNVESSNNTVTHCFPEETGGTHTSGHVCPACGTAVVTADYDNRIKYGGVDVNSIANNTVSSWNKIVDYTIPIGVAPNGKLLAPTEKAAFTYDNNPAGGNGVTRIGTATLLGNTLASGDEWTNPGNLTVCPVINTTPHVKLVIPENGYTTFSSDENVDFGNAVYTDNTPATDKFKAYRATKYTKNGDSSQLYFTSTAALPSTEGAFVHGETGTYWLPILDSAPAVEGVNGMKVGNTSISPSDNIYVLASSSSNPLGLYRLGVAVDVPFGYSYLNLSGISSTGSGSKAYRLSFVLVDDVTGIEEVVDCHTNGRGTAAYNIGGGQVGNSYRGIVIRNGVKFLNK